MCTGLEIAAIAASVASAGVGAASAAGAFSPGDPGAPPDRADAMRKAEADRRRRALAQGTESTILGGSTGAPGQVGVRTLLGG